MTINGGSSVITPEIINDALSNLVLKLPGDETPAPKVELAKPDTPNPSQALTDANNAVDIPSFEDKPEGQVDNPPPPPGEVPEGETTEEEVQGEDDDSDVDDKPIAENFRKLRESRNNARKEKRELQTKFEEANSKLEKYEKGEAVPGIIQAKDTRIQELEKFEKIVNLKLSPEYQNNFVKPAIAARTKLENIGNDYGLTKEFMHKLVEIDNIKDLNKTLSTAFDDVGALEVKNIIGELQDLGDKAIEAEKEPQQGLQQLRSQAIEKERQEISKRMDTFDAVSRDAWDAALEKTAKEGVYKELIINPTNSEYNKTVVEPTQHRAAIQYGALVKKMTQHGLKELPPEFAAGLARMVILSIGGAMNLNAKAAAEKKAAEVMENTKRNQGYMRPGIGGQNGSGGSKPSSAPTGPTNPKEAAAQVKFPGM